MLKKIEDFPDLEGNDIYKNLSLSHFEQGLSTELIIDDQESHYSINGVWSLINKKHILYLLYQRINNKSNKDNPEEIRSFFKSHLLKQAKEKRINQQVLNDMAFLLLNKGRFTEFEFLIKNKLVDINIKTPEGDGFLLYIRTPEHIQPLIELGCNPNAINSNPQSKNFNETVFETILSLKNKEWINHFKQYLSSDIINQKEKDALNNFIVETDLKKQMRMVMYAIQHENYTILNEIITNQTKYDALIKYEDGNGKNLIFHAISNNAVDILNNVLELTHYQNNKDYINQKGICYTSYACKYNRPSLATALYEGGFKNDKVLEFYIEGNNSSNNNSIIELMIKNGYDASLETRFQHGVIYQLEEKLKRITTPELTSFFKETKYMFYLAKAEKFHGSRLRFEHENYNQGLLEGVNRKLDFICLALKQQEKVNHKKFKENFTTMVSNIGDNDDHFGLRLSSLILKNFPEKEKEILNILSINKKDWIIKLNKENLENLLNEFDAPEPKKKKLKI